MNKSNKDLNILPEQNDFYKTLFNQLIKRITIFSKSYNDHTK